MFRNKSAQSYGITETPHVPFGTGPYKNAKRKLYPRKEMSLEERKQFALELKHLPIFFSEKEGATCYYRTPSRRYWQAALSCLAKKGMPLQHAARWESQVWDEAYRYAIQHDMTGEEFLASALTGASKLGHFLTESPKESDILNSMIQGTHVPWNRFATIPEVESFFQFGAPSSPKHSCGRTGIEKPEFYVPKGEEIQICWKQPWTTGGFLAQSKPQVYVACKKDNCCFVALFAQGSLHDFRVDVELSKKSQPFTAELVDAYRCEADEDSKDGNQEGTSVFIFERMDGTLNQYFGGLSSEFKSNSGVYERAKIEIQKIFDLVRTMNKEGIFSRDAHGENIMYKDTPQGLIWKFIDVESFYLTKQGLGRERNVRNLLFNGIITHIQIDKRDENFWRGIYVDILTVALALLIINSAFSLVFPEWVKQIVSKFKGEQRLFNLVS